jgi:hypothetical protein
VTIRDQLEPYASGGQEAFRFVKELFDAIIAALRRDQHFAETPLCRIELLLADVRADAERRLFKKLRGRIDLDDVDFVDAEHERRELAHEKYVEDAQEALDSEFGE